jgi:hypothetical protein
MRRLALASSALALAGALGLSASGQEAPTGDRPQLGVFADTIKTTIPGLEGVQLPPEAQAALGGFGAQRALRVHLWTPGPAPQGSPTAALDVPAGLKLGPTLDLEIPRPGKPSGADGAVATPEAFEIRRYWGCGEAARAGQPKVVKSGDLKPEQLRGIRARGFSAGRDAWTDAAWPNSRQKTPAMAPAGAALPGKYALRSSYVSGVTFDVPAGVSFLEPLALSGPKEPDPSKAIPLSWKPVPGAVGYVAFAMAQRGKNAMVMWTSAERDTEEWHTDFTFADRAKELTAAGHWLPADRTACTIPAAAFSGCESVSVQVYAFGPSFAQPGSTPAVRVQTRSIGMLILTAGG